MNYEDRITKEYMEGLIPKIVTGTYTGDGERTQVINLGFTPRVVFAIGIYGIPMTDNASSIHFGFALDGSPLRYGNSYPAAIEVVENGFSVGMSVPGFTETNYNGETFLYVALR